MILTLIWAGLWPRQWWSWIIYPRFDRVG
jgi:hypothetical protein